MLLAALCVAAPVAAAGPTDNPAEDGAPRPRAYLNEPLSTSEVAPLPPSPVPNRLYPMYRKMPNPVPDSPESVAKGRLLFGANCKVCHGIDGAEPDVSLNPVPINLASQPFQAARSDGELFFAIQNGVPGSAMLPWGGRLSDRDIWMVVQYLRFLPRAPGTP